MIDQKIALENHKKLLLLMRDKLTYIEKEDKVIKWHWEDEKIVIDGVYNNPYKVWPFEKEVIS